MLETILRLIAKVMNKTSFLFIWPFSISLSLAVRVYGLLFLLLMMTDGAPLLIVTASLPWRHTHTYTSNNEHSPFLLCSKLTGHILGLRAPWGSILAVLSLKTPYLHSVYYLSSVLSHGKGKLRAYYFIGWQKNMLPSSYEPRVMACDSVQKTSK